MILNFNITQIETKAYMSPEEIHKYHNINITNEINIKDPSIIKSSQISGEIPILKVNWSLSINYLNPSMGYIRFTGIMNCRYKDPEPLLTELPVNIKNEMANAILLNMASYLIETAKLHNLPSPIPIPKVDFGKNTIKKDNNDIGYHG